MRTVARLNIALALVALLLLAGCAATEEEVVGTTPVAEEPAGPTDAQIAAAFEATHPGFVAKTIVPDGAHWLVAGQSVDVPAFWIRTWVAPVPGGDVTAVIDGTEWSAERALQEVTENAQLMPRDMRQQFMQAVVADLGVDDPENPGGFVTSVSVVSNMDMSIGYTSDTGDLITRDYVLELSSGDWVPAS